MNLKIKNCVVLLNSCDNEGKSKHVYITKSKIQHKYDILSFLRIEWSSFVNTWVLLIQGFFMSSLIEIGPVIMEKNIFKLCQCMVALSLLSRLRKGHGPPFKQTWILYIQGSFVPGLVEMGPVVPEKKMKMGKVYGDINDDGQRRTTR